MWSFMTNVCFVLTEERLALLLGFPLVSSGKTAVLTPNHSQAGLESWVLEGLPEIPPPSGSPGAGDQDFRVPFCHHFRKA